jgi:FkbM family methyltransferase
MDKNNYILKSITNYGTIYYNKNEDGIGSVLKTGKLWEQDEIENIIKPYIEQSTIILDIGAHIGCHTIAYGKINPNAKIYSFEMQKEMFMLLDKNIKENNLTNVKLFNNAIGNKIGEFETEIKLRDGGYYKPIAYYTDDKFNFGGLGIGIGGEKVNMITIDNLNLEGCDYMKIDVEGFEFVVILGALETIKKYKPVIFYECNQKTLTPEMCAIAGIEYKTSYNVKNLLESIGYNYFNYDIYDNILASVI